MTSSVEPVEIDGNTWEWKTWEKNGELKHAWLFKDENGKASWMSAGQMEKAIKEYKERVKKEQDEASLDNLPF